MRTHSGGTLTIALFVPLYHKFFRRHFISKMLHRSTINGMKNKQKVFRKFQIKKKQKSYTPTNIGLLNRSFGRWRNKFIIIRDIPVRPNPWPISHVWCRPSSGRHDTSSTALSGSISCSVPRRTTTTPRGPLAGQSEQTRRTLHRMKTYRRLPLSVLNRLYWF